ncbi:hypothetical protein JTE90_021988 [Oedothorax gibbosus]|uniref:SSD domain-containing protein n=1 Tax=Oedothorax gibbosus TaxID=931172 RepID=A0AAV6U6P7_9ARAC|nr:hypothetical protein JTE90_021988 [Oedothorax gibbosus]
MNSMPESNHSIPGTRVSLRCNDALRPDSDLLTRTSWADASLALAHIKKGSARSLNERSLLIRAFFQKRLFKLGCCIQRNPFNTLFVGVFVLSVLCVGLKSPTMETNVEKLWVEVGGELETELRYIKKTLGEGVGSTNQILIHTPQEDGSNVLHREYLLDHLQVLKAATQVSVEVFDIPWSLKDMCYSPSFPLFEKHYLDMTLENIFPCAIITPLDCFWEGSKLLGPEYPVKIPGLNMLVQWTNLNPQFLMNMVKNVPAFANSGAAYPMQTIEAFMKRAGITTAYQEKPCLQPSDIDCPESAPNKKSQTPIDIGSTLTGGCYGFATKYMHWPEDVLVGGVTKNKTGHIVRAEALQTIIRMMAEKELFEFWRDHIKVHNLDWSVDKAKKVLEAWQRKFTEIVMEQSEEPHLNKQNKIHVFSKTSLDDIMQDFSKPNIYHLGCGCLAMLVYVCMSKVCNPVNSHVILEIVGIGLVALSIAGGLGFGAILGIVFNAAITQVLPFLALPIGMYNMFFIIHEYTLIMNSDTTRKEDLIGKIVMRTGGSIALTTFICCAVLLAGIILNLNPALWMFVCQFDLVVAFNAITILFIFPAGLVLTRRFLCYIDSGSRMSIDDGPDKQQYKPLKHSVSNTSVVIPIRQAVTHALPPDGRNFVTVLAPSDKQKEDSWPQTAIPASVYDDASKATAGPKKPKSWKVRCQDWSAPNWFLINHLIPTLQKPHVKFATVMLCLCLFFLGIWGICHVKDGLDLTDIVPRNTHEYKFLNQQAKYFGFFGMFAVTQGNFEYPTNQRVLYKYHEAFMRIGNIIKNDDGGLPDFWLSMFRDWLLDLQTIFDDHWNSGCITQEGWCQNATEDAIMAYKLLVQTGRMDNPVDKSLVKTVRLVDKNGIINTKAFYNYLSAWVSNDPLAYSASLANFVPEPRRWIHDPHDVELKMPKSQPLAYAQIPFYLNGMGTTEEITETLRNVRKLCETFQEKGLPNFPTGLLFTYWQQYLSLRFYLTVALVSSFVIIFLLIGVVLNFWAASVVVFILAVTIVELLGFIGIAGIKLSAVSAVILIASIGMGVVFAVPLMMGFITSIGSRERRMVMTLEQMFYPVFRGTMFTLIGVIPLYFSEFDFIFRYFFIVLVAFICLCVVNWFLLFPVFLSIFGPPGEVIPYDDPERIPSPSPEPSPLRQRVKHARPFNRRIYPRVPSEISLSTITEESQSCHSHEIVVQPEVTVETTTVTNTTNGVTTVNTSTSSPESTDSQSEDSSKCNTPCGENSSTSTTNTSTINNGQPMGTTAVTTRITATAKVLVEVHAPFSSSYDISRYRRRRDSSSSRSSSARSSPT